MKNDLPTPERSYNLNNFSLKNKMDADIRVDFDALKPFKPPVKLWVGG